MIQEEYSELPKQPSQQIASKSEVQKVHYFLLNNPNEAPVPPFEESIFDLLRSYLNDNDFVIYVEEQPVFKMEYYQQRLEQFYERWKEEIGGEGSLDAFVIYWVEKEDHIRVEYHQYQQAMLQKQQEEMEIKIPNISSLKRQSSIVNQEKQGYLKNKETKTPSPEGQQDLSLQLLKHFYKFYCQKQVNNISSSTFEAYGQYYSEMNLTKWMSYIKDMGYYSLSRKLKQKQFKDIFIKFQNNNKSLTFSLFQQAVLHILNILFDKNQQRVKQEGYELIGIKSQQSYQQKFRKIGILAPIFNPKRQKAKKNHNTKSTLKLQLNNRNSTEKGSLISHKHSFQTSSSIIDPNSESERGKKQICLLNLLPRGSQLSSQRLNTSNNIFSISTKKNKKAMLNMKDIIKQQQEDPYLKRYIEKQNLDMYHCISNRIDQRINKIINKY